MATVLVLAACGGAIESEESAQEATDGLALVWEAWEKVNDNYVSSEVIDPDKAVSGAMSTVLDLMEVAPYPFLTEIGRMRGQPPAHVPGELVDLWRAVAK